MFEIMLKKKGPGLFPPQWDRAKTIEDIQKRFNLSEEDVRNKYEMQEEKKEKILKYENTSKEGFKKIYNNSFCAEIKTMAEEILAKRNNTNKESNEMTKKVKNDAKNINENKKIFKKNDKTKIYPKEELNQDVSDLVKQDNSDPVVKGDEQPVESENEKEQKNVFTVVDINKVSSFSLLFHTFFFQKLKARTSND